MTFPKTMMKKCVFSLAGILILACQFFSLGQASTPTVTPIRSADLLFHDPSTGMRFHTLESCIRGISDSSWITTTDMGGNYYNMSWCHGAGLQPGCAISDSQIDARDQQIIKLHTIFYQTYPEVFGLGVNAIWIPATTGWGASFVYTEGNPNL